MTGSRYPFRSGRQEARVRTSCMRVMFRSWSRSSSGAEMMVAWISWSATRRADRAGRAIFNARND